jgi:predicted signal transduction protein with EAL and GGDEF domain
LYVAERFGNILAIDSWVVGQAVALIATQAKAGRSLTLNVNISAKSIGNPQLVAVIDRALADAQIDPACLVFELTETAAIGNIDHARTFTTELRSRGCRFALDDFGSGFGSFYYLKHLPFDYFKIDGDFIRALAPIPSTNSSSRRSWESREAWGMKTVAEFVTDQAMADTPPPAAVSTTRRVSISAFHGPSPRLLRHNEPHLLAAFARESPHGTSRRLYRRRPPGLFLLRPARLGINRIEPHNHRR